MYFHRKMKTGAQTVIAYLCLRTKYKVKNNGRDLSFSMFEDLKYFEFPGAFALLSRTTENPSWCNFIAVIIYGTKSMSRL